MWDPFGEDLECGSVDPESAHREHQETEAPQQTSSWLLASLPASCYHRVKAIKATTSNNFSGLEKSRTKAKHDPGIRDLIAVVVPLLLAVTATIPLEVHLAIATPQNNTEYFHAAVPTWARGGIIYMSGVATTTATAAYPMKQKQTCWQVGL